MNKNAVEKINYTQEYLEAAFDEFDESGDAFWDQRTDSRQITAPGIYYWAVTSKVGDAKGTLLLIK